MFFGHVNVFFLVFTFFKWQMASFRWVCSCCVFLFFLLYRCTQETVFFFHRCATTGKNKTTFKLYLISLFSLMEAINYVKRVLKHPKIWNKTHNKMQQMQSNQTVINVLGCISLLWISNWKSGMEQWISMMHFEKFTVHFLCVCFVLMFF